MTKKKREEDKLKTGRPSMYSQELTTRICELLSNGVTLRAICQMEDMPSFDTIWRWKIGRPEFSEQLAHAQKIGTHYLADDCIRIADDPTIETADKRVMIDTRLRLIGKWNQYYADKQQVELNATITAQPADVAKLGFDDREALADMLKAIAPPNVKDDDDL
jgi:hypothetical protein